MKHAVLSLAGALALAGGVILPAVGTAEATSDGPCEARASVIETVELHWFAAPAEDAEPLEQWCRGVGGPLIATIPEADASEPPPLEDLVVVTWNAHLAEGKLIDLVADLQEGVLTDDQPVRHFILLLQELYRRGDSVPAFGPNARAAYAIQAREPHAPDAVEYARRLGLAMSYVPSMRNGAEMLEDRGNAILSTEPLQDLFALELPLERQRRVAAGAAIEVKTPDGVEQLQFVDAHLEPLAAPSSLWLFRNPRIRQMAALLDLLQEPRFHSEGVGTVLGGDFNTVQGGAREEIYQQARAWSQSLTVEDERPTHMMGRLDYLFARLAPGWQFETMRVSKKYGSDHHPVLARFRR